MTYRLRLADAELARLLRSIGAVVIEGPKACGKTETARQIAASEVRLDVDPAARVAAELDPQLILSGTTPRLLDEWQSVPAIWNHVRRTIDDRQRMGQFILTGSAVPADDVTRHTGAGRIARLRMRPMSFMESGHSTGAVSLQSLLEGEAARAADTGFSVARIAEEVVRGGWPALVDVPVADAAPYVQSYLDEVRRTDVQRVDGVKRDPVKVGRFLTALARHVATPVSIATLVADTGDSANALERGTVSEYLTALERLMIVEPQPMWAPHLRSRTRLRQTAKLLFADPSLAAAALGAGPTHLLRDIPLLGLLFESLVIRDLRIYAQSLDAEVLSYRDNTGLEVDAIVTCADGRWGAFEVKLGTSSVDAGAASLLRFVDKVDTERAGKPAVLAVITGTGYAYRRSDGVQVVPIATLGA